MLAPLLLRRSQGSDFQGPDSSSGAVVTILKAAVLKCPAISLSALSDLALC